MKRQFVRRAIAPGLVVLLGALSGSPAFATDIDLTAAGNGGSATASIGGTFRVQQIDPQSTGTGVIDSFVRIQSTGNESGYNTDISTFGTPLDTMGGGFTTPLLLADVPIVMIGGVAYREFLWTSIKPSLVHCSASIRSRSFSQPRLWAMNLCRRRRRLLSLSRAPLKCSG